MKRLVVMQPTYMPYPGYFNLISKSDVFIFLDDVQFSNQSWQQRNRIKTKDGWIWLTVPIVHNGKQHIKDVRINNDSKWNIKHLKTLKTYYSRSKYFIDYIGLFGEFFSQKHEYLGDMNKKMIIMLCMVLDININYYVSSQNVYTGDRIERLVNMCKVHDCDVYLSTIGAKVYLEDHRSRFEEEGISLVYNDYVPLCYDQLHGGFIENLSVVDLLFNMGKKSRDIIKRGI